MPNSRERERVKEEEIGCKDREESWTIINTKKRLRPSWESQKGTVSLENSNIGRNAKKSSILFVIGLMRVEFLETKCVFPSYINK